MKNKFSITGTAPVDHSTFGGFIYKRDFDERHTLHDISSRILSDWNFDKRCKNNIEIRKYLQNPITQPPVVRKEN